MITMQCSGAQILFHHPVYIYIIKPLNAELIPFCSLLELLVHHILHVSKENIN